MQSEASGPVTNIDLLTCKELSARLRIHPGTIWRMAAQADAGMPCGGFPRPLRLASKTVRWRLRDVEAYLAGLAGTEPRQ
jgi:predicted DNA-binding transcriptional regulator AlpA